MALTLTEAVAATFAAVGQPVTDAGLALIVADLKTYPRDGVMQALSRCRRELKRVTLADIIERIPGGHPGPEEAWAMVSGALGDEGASVVWTEPMREAFFVATALSDDPVAARMAFRETYVKKVAEARERGDEIRWQASLGHDPHGREPVLRRAVEQGLIPADQARTLLPHRDALPEWLGQVKNLIKAKRVA